MFFKSDKYKDAIDLLYTAGTVGMNMVTCTFVGLAMGLGTEWGLKHWFSVDAKPWPMIFFLVMGVVAGFRTIYEEVKRIQKTGKDKSVDGKQDSDDKPED